jgi:hypothetical protein
MVVDCFTEGARRDPRNPRRYRRVWLSTAAGVVGVAVLVAAFMAAQNLRTPSTEFFNPWAVPDTPLPPSPESGPTLATLHVRAAGLTKELDGVLEELRPFEIVAFRVVGAESIEIDVSVPAEQIALFTAWAAARGARIEPSGATLQQPGRYRVRMSSPSPPPSPSSERASG